MDGFTVKKNLINSFKNYEKKKIEKMCIFIIL